MMDKSVDGRLALGFVDRIKEERGRRIGHEISEIIRLRFGVDRGVSIVGRCIAIEVFWTLHDGVRGNRAVI